MKNDDLTVSVLRTATSRLLDAINRARFCATNVEFPVSKYFKNLLIDPSHIGKQPDNPSIKKALCYFLLEHEKQFGLETYNVYKLSQYFIFYLNNYLLRHPSKKIFALKRNEESYRLYYERWLSCVAIPAQFKRYYVLKFYYTSLRLLIFYYYYYLVLHDSIQLIYLEMNF